VAPASAHYLWVTIDKQPGTHGATKIYFEEGPAAGDGSYLDHFTTTSKTWFRSVKQIEPRLIETQDVREEKRRWLQAELPEAGPRSVDCYGKFGVYAYGKTNVLLHYYARSLDVASHDALHELGRSEQMQLDIVPHESDGQVELTVLWQGKPAAQRVVFVRGPERFRKNLTTDDRGRVRLAAAKAGRYFIRTNVELDTPGRDGDQEYALIRHHATLVMRLPLER
jgi:hypothetical protein